jgi:MFS family permease
VSAGPFSTAFRHRDARALLVSHALQGTGQTLGTVAVAALLYDRTESTTWVAAGATARLLPYVLVSSFAGVIAERVALRSLLLASSAARATTCVALVLLVSGGPPAVIVALVFAGAAAGTFCYPAVAAALPLRVPTADLAAANAVLSTLETGAFVVGPAVGGLALALGGVGTAFTVNALVFVLAMVPLARMASVAVSRSERDNQPMTAAVRDTTRLVTSAADLAVPIVLVVAVNFVLGVMGVLLLPVAVDRLDVGEAGYGLLNTATGVGAFAGVAVSGWLAMRRDALRQLVIGVIAAGAPVAVLAVVASPAAACALLVASGLGGVVTEVVALTILQRALPPSALARVAGLFDALVVGAVLVGSAIAPVLAGAGLRGALVIVGAVVPGLGLLAARRMIALEHQAAARRASIDGLAAGLRALPALAGAPPVAVEALAAGARLEEVAAGMLMVSEGEPPDDLFFVCAGQVEVEREGVRVAVLRGGDSFGDVGLLEGIPRNASVRSLAPVTLARIDGALFLAAVNGTHPSAASAPGASALRTIP